MSSRREEIEAKRQRLQELRRQREEKEKEKTSRDSLGGYESRRTSQLHEISSSHTVGSTNGHASTSDITPKTSDSTKKESSYKSISIQTEPEESNPVQAKEIITYNKATQTIDYEALVQEEEAENAPPEIIPDSIPAIEEEETKPPAQAINIDETTIAQFFQESFQIINRTIEDDKDVLQNYSKLKKTAIEERQLFVALQKFKVDNNEGIYSFDVSNFFLELLVISTGYDLYIYNSKFQKFEHHFKSTTKILNIQFSQFQSNLIFGTGFNGKVVIWNLETTLNHPYLESPLGLDTHAYPVWCLDQISENMGILITASTDGRVLTWDPQILAKPSLQPIELTIPRKLGIRYDEMTPLHITHLHKEHGFLLIGAEDGHIYKIKRFDNRLNSNSDKLIDKIYTAHKGPIAGLSASTEWNNLFLSCSLDWNVYLWDQHTEQPLLQIYKSATILGCQWRPNHPTQIGYIYDDVLEILDLSIDPVTPILKLSVGEGLNRFVFDKEGENVYLASIRGDVYLYELLLDTVQSDIGKFKRKYVKN